MVQTTDQLQMEEEIAALEMKEIDEALDEAEQFFEKEEITDKLTGQGKYQVKPEKRKNKVFVRIRPLASEGGHADGEQMGNKKLNGFTDKSLTITDIKSTKKDDVYTYPTHVIGPDIGQQETYDTFMPEMINAFVQGYNCTFFAYGQTGSGKTHTMFGASSSLKHFDTSGQIHEDWGIFPRAVMSAMDLMANSDKEYKFTASVIDLYFFEFFDLLNDRKKLVVQSDSEIDGYVEMELKTPGDVCNLVNMAMNHRVSHGTKMNEHSSRSHALATVKLTQFDKQAGSVVESEFILCDFAGSERQKKTGETKQSVKGMEGICVNIDLYALGSTFEQVAKQQKAKTKQKVKIERHQYAPLSRFLIPAIQGESILCSILCVSQATQNGSETWFTLKWGEPAAQLEAMVQPQKTHDLKDLMKQINEENEKLKAEIDRVDASGAKGNPYQNKRKMRFYENEKKLNLYSQFMSM